MGIYGRSKSLSKQIKSEEVERPLGPDDISPFRELCKFTDHINHTVEIDKPFDDTEKEEFDYVRLIIRNAEGEEVIKEFLEDITHLDKTSADILNDMSKVR